MPQYIDITPTWEQILPAWRRIVEDAVKIKKPDQMDRFWTEMQTMARAADKWNEECKLQQAAANQEQEA